MAEGDQMSAERSDIGSSVKESIKETEVENGKASDERKGKDITSQEEETEQSFETHSSTGICTSYSHDYYN